MEQEEILSISSLKFKKNQQLPLKRLSIKVSEPPILKASLVKVHELN
jgi:hypothetical protein